MNKLKKNDDFFSPPKKDNGCSGCGKRIKRNNLRQRNNSRKKIKKKF